MTLIFRLADHGSTFSTRPRGVELRSELLDRARSEEDVCVDFSEVLSISYSFADEFAGDLAQAAQDGDLAFTPSFVGASPEVKRVLIRAFENRVVPSARIDALT